MGGLILVMIMCGLFGLVVKGINRICYWKRQKEREEFRQHIERLKKLDGGIL